MLLAADVLASSRSHLRGVLATRTARPARASSHSRASAGRPTRARRAVRADLNQLARARSCIEHAGVQHDLFPAGGVPFGARDEDVVEQRSATDETRMRARGPSGQIEPVVAVRAHHLGIAIVDLSEELTRSG